MNVYEFSGMGNYSYTFDWDSGLTASIGKKTTAAKAREIVDEASGYSSTFNTYNPPDPKQRGVYRYFNNENGGSRNARGYVVARNETEAQALLDEWSSENYPIKEYVRP